MGAVTPAKNQTLLCEMTSKRPSTSDSRSLSDRRRKRAEWRRRVVGSACYIALGILLFYAYHVFKAFEGPVAAVGPLPHDHPMHRVVEAGVFLAVAIVPAGVYVTLGLVARRRKK